MIDLPLYVKTFIDQQTNTKADKWGFNVLSSQYSHHSKNKGYLNQAHRLSYLQTRLPATYACIFNVFEKIDLSNILTVLDIGSGPGTAGIVLQERGFGGHLTMIEEDIHMSKIATDLFRYSPQTLTPIFVNESVQTYLQTLSTPYDLIILSYVLNEWPSDVQLDVLEKIIPLCSRQIVLIYPGRPENFQELLKARDFLMSKGLTIDAPCTHHRHCPLTKDNNWCHFSQRLIRSSAHKIAKSGQLGYEDEKFCYLVASKKPSSILDSDEGRIVFPPIKRKGHIIFDVCVKGTIVRKTISKSNTDYALAKGLSWGDKIDF